MQIVPAGFNALANADVRPISTGIRIAFDKTFDDDVTFFTLNQSILNGQDILAPAEDNPIQAWDYYNYQNFTERIVDMTVSRTLEFPYSVVSSIADFTLNNYDGYFTPNGSSPIAPFVLPKRPVRLLQGFSNTLLPQFVGLTQGMAEISRTEGTATFTALDFLTMIFDMDIRNTIALQNVRTDQVLENIFQQFGLTPDQYNLERGSNMIPFLFFEREQLKVGDVIRPLMQAEGGRLWLDEQGIIRFSPRVEQPNEATYTFDYENIVSIDNSGDDEIINRVVINTQVREVQEFQTVYTKSATDSQLNVIPANSSFTFSFALQDPALTIVQPVFGNNAGVSWFTAALPNGTNVTDGVSITSVELKTNTYDITFSNTNAFDVNINQLVLWGQPAKNITVDPVVYENKETDSIEKYQEEFTYEITNNFIQNISSARSLALSILADYSEYADIVEMEVKGNPAIQLADVIEINYNEYSGTYRIIGITNKVQGQKYTQVIKCRKYDPLFYFILNQSVLNGSDVLAP